MLTDTDAIECGGKGIRFAMEYMSEIRLLGVRNDVKKRG